MSADAPRTIVRALSRVVPSLGLLGAIALITACESGIPVVEEVAGTNVAAPQRPDPRSVTEAHAPTHTVPVTASRVADGVGSNGAMPRRTEATASPIPDPERAPESEAPTLQADVPGPLSTATRANSSAAPPRAQQTPEEGSPERGSEAEWWERVSFSVRYGGFLPTANSEAFRLFDDALTQGPNSIRPTLLGASMHVQLTSDIGLQLGVEAGKRTVASMSQVRAAPGAEAANQQTSLEITTMPSLGIEWQAIRLHDRGGDAAEHTRLTLGAGLGVASYRLRQWGDFIDEERQIEFPADFHSAGRGTFGYASAGIEMPVSARASLQGEVRRQFGSAPMTRDFADFDRLDLGGTGLTVGLRIHAASPRR